MNEPIHQQVGRVGRGLRVDQGRIRELLDASLARLDGPLFEVGAPVFIEPDEAADAYGPFTGASGGTVIDVLPYPGDLPTLYVVRTPGRADHPYVAARLRLARCRRPDHEHNERRPVFLCPDRAPSVEPWSYHGSGVALDLPTGPKHPGA